MAADLADAWLVVARQRGRELTAPVRARLVVVMDVGTEDQFEVTSRVDEQPIEALFPDGADPALGERVGARRQRHPVPLMSNELSE